MQGGGGGGGGGGMTDLIPCLLHVHEERLGKL